MKKRMNKLVSLILAMSIAVPFTASNVVLAESEGADIVNIGVTNSIGGMNPLVIDQTEVNVHAMGLQFLPLVDLDSELNFQGMLADSITTEDNQNFVVIVFVVFQLLISSKFFFKRSNHRCYIFSTNILMQSFS